MALASTSRSESLRTPWRKYSRYSDLTVNDWRTWSDFALKEAPFPSITSPELTSQGYIVDANKHLFHEAQKNRPSSSTSEKSGGLAGLQQLFEADNLVGMHCFRHLGDQLASAVHNMLAADFVRVAILDSKDLESSAILASLNMKDKLYSISTEVRMNEDEETELREQLIPLVIRLLRTSKLPAVLKVYKEALTTDIKTAIKTVVAESLPVLLAIDSVVMDKQTDSDVSGMSVANKLRNLPSEGFVQLLIAVFRIVQNRLVRAAKIRDLVEQIVSGLPGTDAADAVAAAIASGAAAAEAAQEQLQDSHPVLAQNVTNNDPLVNISEQLRANVLRENTETIWAACDAAHGRWGKLLGVRTPVLPKLRLQEFVSIYNVTKEFISATEKVGGRLGHNLLQSQLKSFVDSQHLLRVSKITTVLDQETWRAVDVPEEFQSIVDKVVLFDEKVPSEAPQNRIRKTSYYIVNSGLILLKMMSEYVDISIAFPDLNTEVIHHLTEILKAFNSRTCELVLGAGALQVWDLTAKKLALASQTITFFHVLIHEMMKIVSGYIPDSLLEELERVAHDYKTQKEEIYTKLVQIPKERVGVHGQEILVPIVEGWNNETSAAAADDDDMKASTFALTLTREIDLLHKVLTPILPDNDVRSIFSRVVQVVQTELTGLFLNLQLSTPEAIRRLFRDATYIFDYLGKPEYGGRERDLHSVLAQRFGLFFSDSAKAAGVTLLTIIDDGPFTLSKDAFEDCTYLGGLEVSEIDEPDEDDSMKLLVRVAESVYHVNCSAPPRPTFAQAVGLIELYARQRKLGFSAEELDEVAIKYLQGLNLPPNRHDTFCLVLGLLEHPARHIARKLYMQRPDRPRMLFELSQEELDHLIEQDNDFSYTT